MKKDDSRQCITPGRNAKICPKVLSKTKLEKKIDSIGKE